MVFPTCPEVNAIIFKASAGSKYHANQLKRQAELETRIAQLLKLVSGQRRRATRHTHTWC